MATTTAKKKTKRRRNSAVSGPAKTRKFNGKTYKHNSCSTSKRTATATAKKLRAQGKNARVVSTGSRHCVYSRG